MKRLTTSIRPNWQHTVEQQGLSGHTYDDGTPYWNEGVYYECSQDEVDTLVDTAVELHTLFLSAIEHCIEHHRLDELGIPPEAFGLIEQSWQRQDPYFLARFDFLLSPGTNQPKLVAIRADSPPALVESSEIQWHWKEELFPEYEQYNNIYEMLLKSIREAELQEKTLHFTAPESIDDEFQAAEYLSEIALELGFRTVLTPVGELEWDHEEHSLTDQHGDKIERLFKMYPWELLLQDKHGPRLVSEPSFICEPAWKMVASSKGFLALLWELAKDHRALLPHYFENSADDDEKEACPNTVPFFPPSKKRSAGLTIPSHEGVLRASHVGRSFEGHTPRAMLWMIRGVPAGLGFIEQADDSSRAYFVPHIIHEA